MPKRPKKKPAAKKPAAKKPAAKKPATKKPAARIAKSSARPAAKKTKAASQPAGKAARASNQGALDPRLAAAIALALEAEQERATQLAADAPSAWAAAGRIRRMQTAVTRR